MGLSNKLGVLFVGVNLLLPALAHALVIEPVKIDSSQGEPLYAEIPFHNASNQSPLQVSIAQPFELGLPEVIDAAKIAHFNFYVRQNNQGNGVIVITSSRPMHESALDLVLKINDNGQVHMQQLHNRLPSRIDRLKATLEDKPLQPRIVVNEDDLKLNLPESSTLAQQEQSLVINNTPPPSITTSTSTSNVGLAAISTTQPAAPVSTTESIIVSAEPVTAPAIVTPPHPQQSDNLNIQVARRAADQPATVFTQNTFALPPTQIQEQPAPVQAKPVTASTTRPANTAATATKSVKPAQQHSVKANESLWAIANQIAKNQNISVTTVMHDIHQNNQHAFIHGNANRLKQGAILNIPATYALPSKPAQTTQTASTITKPVQPTEPQKQNEAHMSIVANTNQGSIQGTNKTGESSSSTQQNELTIQLKQARGNTISLQNNVRQLDQQLREKEKRIALLNARLAELEQQLKSRQTPQNSSADVSNTTSKSQGVIPALIAGTLVVFAGLNSNFAIATLLQELI